jgi:2-deoxy-scyllo-inosamine dehydrogenase (SAM-dependent)
MPDSPTGFAAIREIEIEPTTACTRRCWFCDPAIPHERRTRPVELPLSVWHAILHELVALDYQALVTFCGLGEPFLHPQLAEFVQLTAAYLPKARIKLFTNGDAVTDRALLAIADGVDDFVFSDYDGNAVPQARFAKMFGARLRVDEHWRKAPQTYQHRAGKIRPLRPEQIRRIQERQGSPCPWFPHQLFLAATGYWIACCNDTMHEHRWPLGIKALFSNPEYLAMRAGLAAGQRSAFAPCRNCDVPVA